MHLTNEAAYLYVLSKELTSLNKKLKSLSKKAEKHVHKHSQATTPEKKEKHKLNHTIVTKNIKQLLEKHNTLLKSIQHHHTAFYHALRKEHKI